MAIRQFQEYENKLPILVEDNFQPGPIGAVYLAYIKNLFQVGRIANAFSWYQSFNTLKKFRGNGKFTDVSVSYLHLYEQWMRNANFQKAPLACICGQYAIYLTDLKADITAFFIKVGLLDRQ